MSVRRTIPETTSTSVSMYRRIKPRRTGAYCKSESAKEHDQVRLSEPRIPNSVVRADPPQQHLSTQSFISRYLHSLRAFLLFPLTATRPGLQPLLLGTSRSSLALARHGDSLYIHVTAPKERAEDRAERIEMREKIEAMEREKEEGRREGDVGENSGDAEGERCGEEGEGS
jgi:hypothetical protein